MERLFQVVDMSSNSNMEGCNFADFDEYNER